MDDKSIIVQKKDGICTITLNQPEKLNALTDEMKIEIAKAIKEAEQDNEVRVMVITGAGRGFCSGADTATLGEATASERLKNMQIVANMILAVLNSPKPVIAAINGVAVGVGFSLALACDIIIASEKARFGGVWVRLGLHPDGGASYLLPRRVGVGRACELLLSGRIIDADEADKIGLVNRVVKPEELMKETKGLAQRIASGPKVAVQFTKRALYRGMLEDDLQGQVDYELYLNTLCFRTEDFKEGVRSFLEKRKPVFKGK